MSDADSAIDATEDFSEPESGFDMDGAVESLGSDLFPNSEEFKEDENDVVEEADDSTESDEIDEDTEETTEPKEAPKSWKKEMHEVWKNLTPEAQEYIELREQQMKEGLETDRNDANLGKMMRDVMSPYSDMLKSQNLDEPTAVKYFMNTHYQLTNANPQQKEQLIKQIAKNYGVDFDGGQTEEVDPKYKQLEQELYGIKSALNQREQADLQAARERVNKEVEIFASEHPYFEEVEGDLAELITAGLSLEDAYETAIWKNPLIRQKELDRINAEKEAEKLKANEEKVQKAKKAKAVNVKSRDTNRTPTESLGTMEDTIRATFREIQSR